MRQRLFWMGHSVVALMLGALLYLLFREKTYFHTFLGVSALPSATVMFAGASVLRYYAVDFLWAYSLCCGLYTIASPKGWKRVLPPLCSIGLGIAWEWLQWFGTMQGTGDVLDILSYGMAALFVFYINFRKEGKL